jgi:thiol-disulfide isomerase/thioredoxin
VIDKLLKEGPAPLRDVATTAPTTQFIDPVVSADWLEGESAERGELDALQGKAPPPLPNGLWLNSKPLKFPELKGKVILLDFWATWCPPCFEAIPHLNEMMDKYGREGFVIIGVCHPTGVQKMAAVVKDKGIRFPVVADPGEKFIDACKVDGFPDYFFIDRAGKLRIADCKNTQIENAIKALLSEPQPAATSPTRSPSTRRTR